MTTSYAEWFARLERVTARARALAVKRGHMGPFERGPGAARYLRLATEVARQKRATYEASRYR